MKYVPAPALEEIRIRNLYDTPMFNGVDQDPNSPTVGQPKPWMLKYSEFLLARTADESFLAHGGKKEGIDALELMQLARLQIKANEHAPGAHAFDDEVAARLRQAILKPKTGNGFALSQELEHNIYEWAMLWKPEPRSTPPAVLHSEPEASTS